MSAVMVIYIQRVPKVHMLLHLIPVPDLRLAPEASIISALKLFVSYQLFSSHVHRL